MGLKTRGDNVLDAVVIGSGVGGLYALQRLRDQMGLTVRAFDDAGDVGGTWYWNRYPGCRVDTEASIYCYSFDEELFHQWQWSERYPRQPEVLAYLNAVADRHDLRRSISFNTRVTRAVWNEQQAAWFLETDRGEQIAARFVFEAVGLLSSTKPPDLPGTERFDGRLLHASRWPHEPVDLSGLRVGVIGTGSTGIQVITDIAPVVGELTVFQRTPQYVVPLGCGPFPAERRARMDAGRRAYVDWALDSGAVFGLEESTTPAMSVSAPERARIYEKAWAAGGGFGFMLETFGDLVVDEQANRTATDFVREKIRTIVQDPETAERLCPHDLYAKRPLAVDGYYETFNRDNVRLVDVRANPIETLTPVGVRTAAGEIALDVIILATGFDAVTGNYLKIDTTGRDGLRLQDKWAQGPKGFMGMSIAGFPNLFMIFGPFGPFTSQPLVHEYQINWMTDLVASARERGVDIIDTDHETEKAWVELCREGMEQTLFHKTDSWINGANVPGKPRASMFYMGGMAGYMAELDRIVADDYAGFRFS